MDYTTRMATQYPTPAYLPTLEEDMALLHNNYQGTTAQEHREYTRYTHALLNRKYQLKGVGGSIHLTNA